MEGRNYIFSESSVHELHSLSKKLYLSFERADKKLIENNSCLTHNFEVDYSLRPWEFYDVRIGACRVYTVRLRNGTFTIYCEGFRPELPHYDDIKLDDDFYFHLFGSFRTFDECKNAFADVVTSMLTFKVRALF